ncbi:MAG: hypothetical protein DYG88_18175 [Chloroflexi bacterium CFX4]|nr:hypothetical protein [Chloroflexi bacterium CFX4]
MINIAKRNLLSVILVFLISVPTLAYAQESGIGSDAKGVWSPDGRYIGTITKNGYVRIFDTINNTETTIYQGSSSYSMTIAWSPDSSRLAATAEDNDIAVWEIATGQRLWSLTLYSSYAVAWKPNGSQIALLTSLPHERMQIFDTVSWQKVAVALTGGDNFDMAWSPDGQKIAIGSLGLVEWFDANTLTLLHRSATAILPELTIAWSPDSSRIVSANLDGNLRIRNAADGAIEQVWAAHEDGAYSVAWHPDGTRLVSGGEDGTVKVWAAASGQLLQTIQVGQPVWWAAWSPDGGRLAYGTETGTPQIISVLPTATPTLPPTDLRALYAAYNSAPVTPVLHPSVVIRNHGNTPVPLGEVRLRYYFTRDGSADLQASCTFIPYYPSGVLPDIIPEPQPCGSSVIVETGALTTPTATVDSYVELRFTDGTLPANGYTVQYILAVNKADWSAFQQTNDYSYSAFGTYPLSEWHEITLTRQGVAVWGSAPR